MSEKNHPKAGESSDEIRPAGVAPGATQKAESSDPAAARYVVLHGQVGHRFFQGDVVAADQFGDDREVRRLVDLEAIRPATDAEKGEHKVTLTAAAPSHPTFEQKMADQQAQIVKLQNQLAEAQQKFSSMRAAELTKQAAEAQQPRSDLIRQKDAAFEDLRLQNEALKRQLQAAGVQPEAGGQGEPGKPADYESWTVEQLHAEAAKRDLHGRGGLDKAGLVKLIQKADHAGKK
jgi:hypothetical protein